MNILHPYSKQWKLLLLEAGLAIQLLTLFVDSKITIYGTAIFAISTCIYFFLNKRKCFKIYCPPITIFFYVYFLIHLTGIIWAIDRPYAFREMERYISFLLFPVLFSMVQFSTESTKRLAVFFVRSALVFCLLSLVNGIHHATISDVTLIEWIKNSKTYYPLITTLFSEQMHPTFVAMSLITAYITAAYLRSKKNIRLVEYISLLILIGIYIVLSGSRMGLLAFIAIIGLDIFLLMKFSIKMKVVIGIAGLILCFLLFFKTESQITNRHDPIRERMHRASIEKIKEHPLTGYGTGGYRVGFEHALQTAIHDNKMEEACFHCFHSHNQYIDETLQYGVVWLCIFCGYLLYLLWFAFRFRNYGLLLFIVLQLLHMFSDSPLLMQREITLFTVIMCFFALPFFTGTSRKSQQFLK